jgi:hypothetical protein
MKELAVVVFAVAALQDPNMPGNGARHRTWDPAKDIATTGNQVSFNQGARQVWYFMESHALVHNPRIYRFLDQYNAPARPLTGIVIPDGFSCWQDETLILPDVCFNFNDTPVTLEGFDVPPKTLDMHPGTDRFAIVAWKSPLNGTVRIEGAFGDLHAACGNGVLWSVDRGSETLKAGDLPNGATQSFSLADVTVTTNDVLYFIVDPKDDFMCDSTRLDVTITH